MTKRPSSDLVAPRRERLESWKEIAGYLNRSERTVRRWETSEGLPVHRLQHEKRGSVYGYTFELDAWRESRRPLVDAAVAEPEDEAAPVDPASAEEPAGRPAVPGWRSARWTSLGIAIVLVMAIVAAWSWVGMPRRAGSDASHVPHPEAVRLLRLGNFGPNAGRVQIETGLQYFQDAVRVDPLYANAWSSMATAHAALTWFGERPPVELQKAAKSEAMEALRLDPTFATPWRVLGLLSHFHDWDHEIAEQHFRKALELDPNNAVTLSWYGDFLTDLRRFDEALVTYRRAQQANPRWLEPITNSGTVHLFTGKIDLAIAEYQKALAIEPSYGLANHFLGRAYLAAGDHEKAIAQLRKSNALLGEVPFSVANLGYALARAGRRQEAEAMLAGLTGKRDRGYYPAFAIGEILLGLGDSGRALDWFERAADEHSTGFYLPSVDPVYDPLRSHPRFVALMQRMRLAGHAALGD